MREDQIPKDELNQDPKDELFRVMAQSFLFLSLVLPRNVELILTTHE